MVAVIAVLYSGVKQIPQGYQWTVLRFGRYHATLLPGLNLIVPFIDRVGKKINVQETVLPIEKQPVITKDNAAVTVDGVVFYQIFEAAKAAYEVQNRTCYHEFGTYEHSDSDRCSRSRRDAVKAG